MRTLLLWSIPSVALATPAFPLHLEGRICQWYSSEAYPFTLELDDEGCVDCDGLDGTGTTDSFIFDDERITRWDYDPVTRRITGDLATGHFFYGTWFPRQGCIALAAIDCEGYYCAPFDFIACTGPVPTPIPPALDSPCW